MYALNTVPFAASNVVPPPVVLGFSSIDFPARKSTLAFPVILLLAVTVSEACKVVVPVEVSFVGLIKTNVGGHGVVVFWLILAVNIPRPWVPTTTVLSDALNFSISHLT